MSADKIYQLLVFGRDCRGRIELYNMDRKKFGILTVSDRCYSDEKLDISGRSLKALIEKEIRSEFTIERKIVPDELFLIKAALIEWCDDIEMNVILTTGGTGFAPRDVTPEATNKVIQKEAPGISYAMLNSSLKITPLAMLSRAVCGIRNKTLIINLPGSPKAVKECFYVILPVLEHGMDIMLNRLDKVKDTHDEIQKTSLSVLPKVTDRDRTSPYPMISVESALDLIREQVSITETEIVTLGNLFGRISSDDIYSKINLPPFRASIKDGYAVVARDKAGEKIVLGNAKAGNGDNTVHVVPGTCVRINTGAPVPEGADAVVQVEDTVLVEKDLENREEKIIKVLTIPQEGQDIRPVGSDIKKGELILTKNTRITATEMGLLASCGVIRTKVYKLPTVGILSTGDELQSPEEDPTPNHVFDSNRITIITILQEIGFKPLDFGIVKDEETQIIDTLTNALKQVDVLITSGSVSMGDMDLLKPILCRHFGATIHFGRVHMKPGKPIAFATCYYKGKKKYFLCLPGNPVSATVTTYLFVLPMLNLMHSNNYKPPIVRAELSADYKLDSRPEFARAFVEWNNEILPKACILGNQISSRLTSCRNFNAFLILPTSSKELPKLLKGDTVEAMIVKR